MVEPRSPATDTVREAIDHALLIRRMSGKMLAVTAGLTPRTWARRRAHGDWTIRELEAVASALGLGIGDLIQGPAHVTSVLCAVRDLNPEPADYAEGHLADIAA